ncbi:MAG: TauD/TfdA family dioxygenase [Deltaproteobacteria bacterium]|nr:TauD/TfdA family dioxygenase [Deltaproteobacteria bacterium]
MALTKTENLLLPLEIVAESDQHQMVAQVDPVDHDDGEVSISQRCREPLRELLAGLGALHDVTAPMRRAVAKGIHAPEEFEAMRSENPPVDHPLVRTHPETGRKSLFLSENTTTKILGLTEQENELLLPLLLRHVKSAEFHCRLRWDPHTIAFWDQRCTLHYAVPDYCERRVMYRLSIDGDVPR